MTMRRRAFLSLPLLPALAAAQPRGAATTAPPLQRGIALGLFSEDPLWSYGELLREIREIGATHVALTVAYYQQHAGSSAIYVHPRFTAPDFAIVRTIREAAAIEPVFFRKHAIANHRISIQKLAELSAAFQRAAEATSETDRCLTHAEFILRELDMLCYDVVVTGWEDGLTVGRGLVVAHFMEFHALYAD